MPAHLFLDTARMGQPRQRAIAAQMSLAHFWAEYGLSSLNDALLSDGWLALDSPERTRFFGLSDWQGVDELKRSLLTLAGVSGDWRTLLANRASKLMEMASFWLTQGCNRILYPDILWPAYQHSFDTWTSSKVRRFATGHDRTRLAEEVIAECRRSSCDGLVLPAVTHLGLRVPYREIAEQLAATYSLKRLVIDGAQEFCHVPTDLPRDLPCLYTTSAQKWLSSGMPMGIAFASALAWTDGLAELSQSVDDSLLTFTSHSGQPSLGETVAVAPMFAARAALAETGRDMVTSRLRTRLRNRDRILDAAIGNWSIFDRQNAGTGIVSLRSPRLRNSGEQAVRARLLEEGLVISAFAGGLVRLSMPEYEMVEADIDLVSAALSQLAPTELPPMCSMDAHTAISGSSGL